jgi:protein-disulfide isomerase
VSTREEKKAELRASREADEAQQQARERRRRMIQYGSLAGFVAVIAVVALVLISQSGGGSSPAPAASTSFEGIPQNGTVLGDPGAKVTIVEYGDLQCPVCQAFSFQVAPALISGPVADGTAKYQFKNWTIIGPQSTDAAKAALAAGEQGRYWNFIQDFYKNQGTENSGYVTASFLERIARDAGVPDIAKWNKDRQDPKWNAVLSQDQNEATGFGFTGTPSILVEGPGGQKPLGTASLQQIEAAITAVQ